MLPGYNLQRLPPGYMGCADPEVFVIGSSNNFKKWLSQNSLSDVFGKEERGRASRPLISFDS